jgi:hypothetical protein
MRGIGKPPIGIPTAFLLVSGVRMLASSEASAQFNIDGIIRGAIQQGGYGYRGPVQHYSSHPSPHPDSDDDSAADNKNGKGVKSTNDGDTGSGSGSASKGSGGGPQSASTSGPTGGSGGGPSGGSGGGPGSGGGASGNPPKTSDDMPSFSPSR